MYSQYFYQIFVLVVSFCSWAEEAAELNGGEEAAEATEDQAEAQAEAAEDTAEGEIAEPVEVPSGVRLMKAHQAVVECEAYTYDQAACTSNGCNYSTDEEGDITEILQT